MTTRAIRIQNGIIAHNALPNDASEEERIGAAMDVAFMEGKREGFEAAAKIADSTLITDDYNVQYVEGANACAAQIAEAIRALSSAPPLCPVCQGDDGNAPCCYPSEGKVGCLRDKRLAPPPATAQEALKMARDTLLFFHEMGGYVQEPVRTAIHKIDTALGNSPTLLKCVSDPEHSKNGEA
jgi:hypothetical protein